MPKTLTLAPLKLAMALVTLVATTACKPSMDSVVAQAAEAQQLLDAGQVAQADRVITAAVQDRDDIPAALIVQARVALAQENRGRAYQAYANVLALEAVNREAMLGVAQLGLSTGHVREAEAAADRILVLQPDQPNALTVKALIAITRSNLDLAETMADRLLSAAPGDLSGLILKSRVQALHGDRESALATLQGGAGRFAEASEYSMALAELHRARGDAAGLLEHLGRVKALTPRKTGYRIDLADTLYRTGRVGEARGEVAELIALPVKDPAAITEIVRLWIANDREALTPAAIELASRKASIDARLAFARFFIAEGRPAVATTLLRPLATGWSPELQGHLAYARSFADSEGAAAEADRLLVKDPENGAALLVRGRHALAEGRARAAVVDAQRVIANYPEWDEGHLALAEAYAALNDRVGMRRAFEGGIKARPQSLPVSAAYIRRLIALNDSDRAIEVARRFALNSPSLPVAWSLYAQTCARLNGSDCRAEAAEGLARARTRFGLDPVPGTPPPLAAIGRLI